MTDPSRDSAPEPVDGAAAGASTDVVLDVLGRLLADGDALHRLAVQRRRWLTKRDLVAITGFSARKLDGLIARRRIPMWRAPDSDEWRLTWRQWEQCEAALIREGLLPSNIRPRRKGRLAGRRTTDP